MVRPFQELETYIHNHPAERIPQVEALAAQLTAASVLSDEVQTDRDHIVHRWQQFSDTVSAARRRRQHTAAGCRSRFR